MTPTNMVVIGQDGTRVSIPGDRYPVVEEMAPDDILDCPDGVLVMHGRRFHQDDDGSPARLTVVFVELEARS